MRIKVFKAADLKEAMAMVKDELGSDAVILHTKRYREGGFLGLNSKEIVEVTAAVDDEPRTPKPRQRQTRSPRSKPQSASMSRSKAATHYNSPAARPEVPKNPAAVPVPAEVPETKPVRRRTKQVATYAEPNLLPGFEPKKEIRSVMAPMRPVRKPIVVEPAAGPVEIPPVQTEALPAVPVSRPAAVQQNDEKDDKIQALEHELAEMKAMLSQVMGQTTGVEKQPSLREILTGQEVAGDVLEDMQKMMSGTGLEAEGKSDAAHIALTGYLQNRFNFTGGIELKPGHSKLVALIGTTGVGKTTTLAKIAARFVLEKGVSAAMITADTYRISAVDQLKTYSDIIGLPLEIVYSPAELKTAIRKFRDKQLVLIDTAGRSQNNEFQMNELVEFLQVEPAMEKHLVLSATTKSRDVETILDKFAPCGPDRLIFTKLDETVSRGLILNLLFKRQMAISYFTNGQSVPDDILPSQAALLAKFLLE